jgi:hypothetical protein
MAQQMKQSEKTLAVATATVLVLALGWLYVVQPLVKRWTDARDRVETLERSLEKSKALVDRRDAVEAERAAIDRALAPASPTDELERAFLGSSVIPTFLEHIRSLSTAAGFPQGQTRIVAKPSVYEAYAELKFELKVRAPLKQIQDFLVRMAASEWYLRVQSLSVHPREDGTIEADITLLGLSTQDALEPEDRPDGKKKTK